MGRYRAKKRLGQNFLTSQQTIQQIIDLVDVKSGLPIIEIGPGRGALTVPLADTGATFIAVEFDRDLIGYLEKLTGSYPNATIVNTDFLKYEPDPDLYPRYILVGNIPYNITSPVIDWCTRYHGRLSQVVLMVQQELAARITSSPGSKDWSPLAIFTQLHFDARHCFNVSPEDFDPQPAVSSTVIELTTREFELPVDAIALDRVVRSAFKQRRKLLVNNLVVGTEIGPDQVREALDHVGLDRKCRAEQVSIDGFLKLTEYLTSRNMIPTE